MNHRVKGTDEQMWRDIFAKSGRRKDEILWGFTYWPSETGANKADFRIFDKNGHTHAKIKLDREALVHMRDIITEILREREDNHECDL